jgi:hypothetical protein
MALMRRKTLLKSNLEYWLNDKLLREGLYRNISIGDADVYSMDMSKLVPISDDEDFKDGQVWQSAFKNWVYESGIPSSVSGVAPPTVASGISVNGTFYPEATTSGAFAHFIDFPNGRVVFLSPILTSSLVQGDFAHKEVTVDFAERFDNERMDLLTETAIKDNPQQTGVVTYPSKEQRTLPAIWIDFLDRENDGYELGSKSLVSDFNGVFHVWGRDGFLRDVVEDIVNDTHRDVILGIDFNTAPFPLLSKGRRNPAYPGYAELARIHSPHFWRRIYMEETNPRKDKPLFEIERTQVRFRVRIFPNF